MSREESLYSAGRSLGSIAYFLDPGQAKFVVLTAGYRQGLRIDWVLNSYRVPNHEMDLATGPAVATGRLKIRKLHADSAIAEVIENSNSIARQVLGDHPGVMAGDTVALPEFTIVSKQHVSPVAVLYYDDLFANPGANPDTFELKASGQSRLLAIGREFLQSPNGALMIKGYTDSTGTAADNKVESYQRALTVRQFLVNALQFDERRVIALGLGEIHPLNNSKITGLEKYNRRIEMKIVHVEP